MNADESVSSGHPLIHHVGDGHEALHRIDFSAFIGVHRRLIAFSKIMLRILAILAVAAYSAPGFAAQTCGADLRGAQRVESEHYVLAYRTLPAKPVVGRHFAVEMVACPKGNASAPARVGVDAYMPEHGHGMNYKAVVKPAGNAHYRAEGLMFHMPGRWDLTFEVQSSGNTERLTRSIMIE
jgi:hypothetical protein